MCFARFLVQTTFDDSKWPASADWTALCRSKLFSVGNKITLKVYFSEEWVSKYRQDYSSLCVVNIRTKKQLLHQSNTTFFFGIKPSFTHTPIYFLIHSLKMDYWKKKIVRTCDWVCSTCDWVCSICDWASSTCDWACNTCDWACSTCDWVSYCWKVRRVRRTQHLVSLF